MTIVDNAISANSRGIYPVVQAPNQSGVAVVEKGKNVIDHIEIGLCRGTVSYPRAQDRYANDDFSGNCSRPSPMNLRMAGISISLPAIEAGSQAGDGIDPNIGANARLRGSIENNQILTLGSPDSKNIGDNGLTFDIHGNSDVQLSITKNLISNAGDAAIGFSLQNSTLSLGQPGSARIAISSNRFGESIDTTVEADLVSNTGSPVSMFRFTGNGNNELRDANVQQQSFNPCSRICSSMMCSCSASRLADLCLAPSRPRQAMGA